MLQKLMEGTERSYVSLDDLNERNLAKTEIREPTIKAPRPNKTNFLVVNHLVSKLESGRTIPITSI